MKIVADAHIPFIQNYFSHIGDLSLIPGRAMTSELVKDADILLVRSVTNVNQSLLKNSRVKFVGSVTAGADHLDTNWLEQAGIAWSVAAGFNAPPVADYVVSVVAALYQEHFSATKKTAAVIGVGNVGRLVVEQLQYLNFDVICCDPLRELNETNFQSTPLNKIENVDLICLHVPLTMEGEYATYHMIDKAFLQRQKPGCVLLNASRGAVIDTNTLLAHGRHLKWCLDVWENEPDINAEALKYATIATPHIAGYSAQGKARGIDMIFNIACEKGVIPAILPEAVPVATNDLHFTNAVSWQEAVLSVFNPQQLTHEMKEKMLVPHDKATFDNLRHTLTQRNEFSYTSIHADYCSEQDRDVLTRLKFSL